MTRLSWDVQPELSGHSALSVIRHDFSLKLTFLLQNRLLPTFFCVLTLPIVYLHHAKLLVSLPISVRKEKPLIKLEALYFPTAKSTCFCSCHLASSRLLWISCASVSPPFIFCAGVHTLTFTSVLFRKSPSVSSVLGFPGSSYNRGDPVSIPGLGRSPGEGTGNPLQDSCLENPMDRGAGWAIVRGVTKSWTQLNETNTSLSPALSFFLSTGSLPSHIHNTL